MAKKATVKKSSNGKHWAGKNGTIGYLARTLLAKYGDSKDNEFYIQEVKRHFKDSTISPADLSIYRRQVKKSKKYPEKRQ